ncbi:metallophosphoesterase family protein [Granulosicoccus antarcticus]|uniref:Putative metallophosphoesterase YhaO n=1 Tax=Granulosicoccus antarcticus IMCC3135 TaxID=1192854 RepID=A0A2Z2NRL1_9GAMM|nr:DNA repair exonuclease [Granulosicoccus antarcticus]ASJ70177.1 putative metallophosphoesterase YhaO [Granulosicoccus antarcticus IMCC3135]
MIKLIHTADVHLDSPLQTLALRDPDLREKVQCASRDAFTRIVEQAIEQRVTAVLIAGDLFDGAARSAKTAAFLLAELDRLKQANIRVFYIKGNHDAENPLTGETSLPDNVYVFDGEGDKVQLEGCDVWIHGVSFSERKAEKSLLGKFSTPVADAINIGMLHTSLNGSASHDVYAPCTVQELIDTGFDYWALGHIHKRQVHGEAPWIVMPGIPQGRDIGEPGPQSATLITIDDGTVTTSEFPTSSIEFTTLLLDVSEVMDATALQSLAKEALQQLVVSLKSDDGIVRVRLQGQSALRWQWLRDQEQWLESFKLLCRETDRLWMEKLIFEIDDMPKSVADKSALGELSSLMSTIRGEQAFNEEAVALINEVLSALPASERAKLLPNEHSQQELAESLSGQGEEQLLAIMKGVGDKGISA